MSTVVLIRPGLTDYDEQSRVLGALEMPMNDKGLEQVEGIVRHLRREGVQLEAVFASPFDPCCSNCESNCRSAEGCQSQRAGRAEKRGSGPVAGIAGSRRSQTLSKNFSKWPRETSNDLPAGG